MQATGCDGHFTSSRTSSPAVGPRNSPAPCVRLNSFWDASSQIALINSSLLPASLYPHAASPNLLPHLYRTWLAQLLLPSVGAAVVKEAGVAANVRVLSEEAVAKLGGIRSVLLDLKGCRYGACTQLVPGDRVPRPAATSGDGLTPSPVPAIKASSSPVVETFQLRLNTLICGAAAASLLLRGTGQEALFPPPAAVRPPQTALTEGDTLVRPRPVLDMLGFTGVLVPNGAARGVDVSLGLAASSGAGLSLAYVTLVGLATRAQARPASVSGCQTSVGMAGCPQVPTHPDDDLFGGMALPL